MSTDNQRALDEKKVREMRRLMAEGGDATLLESLRAEIEALAGKVGQ